MQIPFPDRFHLAVKFMQEFHPIDTCPNMNDEHRLAFYSLFNQATRGVCKDPAPSRFNLTEKAKWDAWNMLKHMSPIEAMVTYVQLVEQLVDAKWLDKMEIEIVPESPPKTEQHSPPETSEQTIERLTQDVTTYKAEVSDLRKQLNEAMSSIHQLQIQLHDQHKEADMLRSKNVYLQSQIQFNGPAPVIGPKVYTSIAAHGGPRHQILHGGRLTSEQPLAGPPPAKECDYVPAHPEPTTHSPPPNNLIYYQAETPSGESWISWLFGRRR